MKAEDFYQRIVGIAVQPLEQTRAYEWHLPNGVTLTTQGRSLVRGGAQGIALAASGEEEMVGIGRPTACRLRFKVPHAVLG